MQAKNLPSTLYRGRFAPSPTGDLHFGSLVAAVGSYLEARRNHGEWLVRIEDLDPPRTVPGAADSILRSLERHQLEWDHCVVFQGERGPIYQQRLEQLIESGVVFGCQCTRSLLRGSSIYPGECRERRLPLQGHSIRLRTAGETILVDDLWQGRHSWQMERDVGDFVIRRADGLFAYQLAVVVDDFLQGITHVIRGSDLLESTPRQIVLQQRLGYPTPQYGHLPVATGEDGEKLSKQNLATPLDERNPADNILMALRFLGQNPPPELAGEPPESIWAWALAGWEGREVPRKKSIQVKSIR